MTKFCYICEDITLDNNQTSFIAMKKIIQYEAPETEVVLLDMGQVMTITSEEKRGRVIVEDADEEEGYW